MKFKTRKTGLRKLFDAAYIFGGVCLIVATAMLPIFSYMVLATEDEPVTQLEVIGPCVVSEEIPSESITDNVVDEEVQPSEETTEETASDNLVTNEPADEDSSIEAEVEEVSDPESPEEESTPQAESTTEEVPEDEVPEDFVTDENVGAAAEVAFEAEENVSEEEENDSDVEESTQDETVTKIDNSNSVDICNETDTVSNTGENEIVSEETVDDAEIETGDVNVYANVLNIVNSNNINSEIVQITENFNNLSADILMNQPETTPTQLSQDLVAGLCQNIHCQSLTTFKLTNNNDATVNNNVSAVSNSGGNSIANAGENATIQTGNVNALVNIINIVNTNVINSRWTIATFNIFGDWEGDLVLPSELYFDEYTTVGASNGMTVHNMNKIVLNITNENTAEINNNVNNSANSGGNAVEGETSEDTIIESGDSVSATNIENVANLTLINSSWFLSIVNTLGSWTGNVYSLPNNVEFEQTPLGMTFFSASNATTGALEQFESAIGDLSNDKKITIEIENNNDAVINNEVDVLANSGENEIEGENVQNTRIITGYSRALANIFNFANTNLINSNLNIGLTNIFGSWNGNIVFGYPDLSVNQNLLQGNVPTNSGARVNYELQYSNTSGSTMPSAVMTWKFDPDLFDYSHSNIKGLYPVDEGVLRVELGKLAPMASGRVQVQLNTKTGLEEGAEVASTSEIRGEGPEKNLENNIHTLRAQASATYNDVPELPNPNIVVTQPSTYIPVEVKQPVISSALFTKITKVNDSEERELKAGDTVKFTVTIDNQNSEKIYSAVMKDQLVGPDGNAVTFDQQELGELLPREKIVFEYALEITEDVVDGTYTNYFWIEGLDNTLQPTKSLTASSPFTVKKDVVPVASETESVPVQPSRPTITRVINPVASTPRTYLPPLVLGAVTEQAQADDGFTEPVTAGTNEVLQLFITLSLVLVAAAGYAVYKSMHRPVV